MKKLWLVAFLLLATPLFGQVTFRQSASAYCSGGVQCSNPSPGINITAGDTLLLWYRNVGDETYTISDNCSQTWELQLPPAGNTATWANHTMLWVVRSARVGAGCIITGVRSAAGGQSFTVAEYSGVAQLSAPASLGPFAIGAAGVVTTGFCPTLNFSSVIAGSIIVAAISANQGTNQGVQTQPWPGATQVNSIPGGTQQHVVFQQPITVAGNYSVQVGVTANAGAPMTYCSTAGIVLSPASVGGEAATAAEQMHTILMTGSGNTNFTLPTAILNTVINQNWCAWIMPTGSASTYQILPESGTQLNGATDPIVEPQWQMSRVCQDTSGHWWAEPPLKAGTNITLTPSATGITISAGTGVGTSMSKIAAGTVNLGNGTQAVPANTCLSTLANTQVVTSGNVGSVTTSDVISWSRQSVAPPQNGWGNGALSVWPEPFAGSIGWWICNSSTTSITPNTMPVNWYVAR
jgi:hypothetical protein